MVMCDAIVRSAGMANLQSPTEMIGLLFQGDNSLDCRPLFIEYAARAIFHGNEGFASWEYSDEFGPIKTPFIAMTKADIAYKALELGVPFHLTWSCYKGGDKHCGRCGTCVERLEAIDAAVKRANVRYGHHHVASEVDATEYEDTEYWKVAVREAKNG